MELTPQEVKQILSAIPATRTGRQDRTMFRLYALSYARVRVITWSDIRRANGRFWLRVARRNGTETWHEITADIHQDLLDTTNGALHGYLPDVPVFSSFRGTGRKPYSIQEINRKLRRYAKKAGVQSEIRIQDLRGVLIGQVEISETNPAAEEIRRCDPRLHGIGRRSSVPAGV